MSEYPAIHDELPHGAPLEQWAADTMAENIQILDNSLTHGREIIPGVIRWFETDLPTLQYGYVDETKVSDGQGNEIIPDHVTFQLLGTEGINASLWRYRFDSGDKHLWGMFLKDAPTHKFRMARLSDDPEVPPLASFEPVDILTATQTAESGAFSVAELVSVIKSGKYRNVAGYIDLEEFQEGEKFLNELGLTIPGIAENGRISAAKREYLLDIITRNTDIT